MGIWAGFDLGLDGVRDDKMRMVSGTTSGMPTEKLRGLRVVRN